MTTVAKVDDALLLNMGCFLMEIVLFDWRITNLCSFHFLMKAANWEQGLLLWILPSTLQILCKNLWASWPKEDIFYKPICPAKGGAARAKLRGFWNLYIPERLMANAAISQNGLFFQQLITPKAEIVSSYLFCYPATVPKKNSKCAFAHDSCSFKHSRRRKWRARTRETERLASQQVLA